MKPILSQMAMPIGLGQVLSMILNICCASVSVNYSEMDGQAPYAIATFFYMYGVYLMLVPAVWVVSLALIPLAWQRASQARLLLLVVGGLVFLVFCGFSLGLMATVIPQYEAHKDW